MGVKLRCKNYTRCRNITASPQNKLCWRKWQLCGDCAVKEHPEAYSEMYTKKVLSKLRLKNA